MIKNSRLEVKKLLKRIVFGMMFMPVVLGMLTLAFNIQPVKAEPRTWTVDDDGPADFSGIQEAVDAASSGDTIRVYDGTYYENVRIKKTLNLFGEDKDAAIIDVHEHPGEAIYVGGGAKNVVISGFTLKNGHHGIVLLNDCSTVSDNILTHNVAGIFVNYASDYIISGNKIIANYGDGIYMRGAHNITFYNNIIDNNRRFGVWSEYSFNNVFFANILSNNRKGIFSGSSFKNNTFYHNGFVNNTEEQVHMYEPQYSNAWDNDYPSGGNYWSDYEERYPDAKELDNSGIWDTPYVIDKNNQDSYPLMEPWTPTPPIPTIDGLKTEIEELGSTGGIDNQGIVKSLLAKLDVAQKLVDKGKIGEAKSILEDDFIPQVENLSDIHVTPEAADILIKSAEYITSYL